MSQLIDLDTYRIISNEIGLKFSEKSWRAADITIFEKAKLADIPLNNKYLEIAPEIVIEIDTKAQLEAIDNPLGYYQEKTDQLLGFGVKKVIWIFTETQKVLIAEKNNDWKIVDWRSDVEILPGKHINAGEIVAAAG